MSKPILGKFGAFTGGSLARNLWLPLVLVLVCTFLIIPPVAKRMQPDPFPSFKDQISKGMTIEEVKKILGEPVKTEGAGELVKVPIEFQLLDKKGNPINRDHVVKAVEGDLILHFEIRRTNVVVRFDKANRVKHCYEHFDIN